MVNSSFYTDGEVYDTGTVEDNDTPGNNAASQAPSSFYPEGTVYDFLSQESAVVELLQALAAQTTTNASSASSSATNAATSAAAAATAVQSAAGTATPIGNGTAAVGTSARWAHEDHVHPTDTSRAPVASPSFTGVPAAPTAAAGTNTTQIATTAYVTTALTPYRTKLSSARTYYVSATGSNSNNGLTPATAFLTIQKAYDTITSSLDLGGQTVTIQTTNAVFDGLSITSQWTGGGNVTLDLGGGTISGTTNVLYCGVPLPGVFTIQNGTLTATTMGLITHAGIGTINVGNITLAGAVTAGYDMVTAFANAYIHFIGNITFGTCSGWREIFYARIGGVVDLYGSFGQTMAMTGNMSWSDSFIYSESGGAIQAISGARTINVGAFTMTGKRYTVSAAAFINTQGGGANYFPGSIAGSGAGTYL